MLAVVVERRVCCWEEGGEGRGRRGEGVLLIGEEG